MRFRTKWLLAITFLLATAGVKSIWGLQIDDRTEASDPAKAELIGLAEEYQRLEEAWKQACDSAEERDDDLSDEEWFKREREWQAKFPGADDQLLPRFLALAKNYPDSPFALDALAFVTRRGGNSTIDVQGEPFRVKEQALEILLKDHMDDRRVVAVFHHISGTPSKKSEAFLRKVFSESSSRTTRAAACYYLARHQRRIASFHQRSAQLRAKERPAPFERFWKVILSPYLEREFPFPDKARVEAEELLTQCVAEFSDVPAVTRKSKGTSSVFFDALPYPTPTTYGDLARTMLFEMGRLSPGQEAPEIEGVDADGKRFRLSDYKGRVVLLNFSANWCLPCVQLYPLERGLVQKFHNEPFTMLSVSLDETIDTLQSSVESGDITWRCWWDGRTGPIREAWDPPGVPTFFLLDHKHIIQDVWLSKLTSQSEFEQSISELLTKAPRIRSPNR